VKPENQKPKALKAKAWKLMSELVRRKHADSDGYVECFTCNTWRHWTEVDAGHGIGGRGNYVLFLEEIIKPQCKVCNGYQGGRYEIFLIKLIELYGVDQVQEWANNARKPFKRTKRDYIELIDELYERLDALGSVSNLDN
jgi:hypothetical protein